MTAKTGSLTAVSLFAGIGGFDLALRHAGVRVAASVEIDPAARGVIRRHFPESKIFNDVREVTGDQLRAAGFVPERGVLCGGFPCQDLSVAGRRAGLGGARSGLFWEIMRLADELSPRWLVLENVPGLLSAVCSCPGDGACVGNGRAIRCGEWRAERIPGSGAELTGENCPACDHEWDVHDAGNFCAFCNDTCAGLPDARSRKVFIPGVPHGVKGGTCRGGCMGSHGGAMGAVLGALGERGYGFAYRVLDAQFFGVPQRRNRVFIVGCLGDPAGPVEVLLEPESGAGHHAQGRETRPGAARAPQGGTQCRGVVGTLGTCGPGGGWRVGADEAAAGQLIAHAITAREAKGADSDATSGFIVASTLQGGGRRGHRIDAEGAAGGHLVATPIQDGRDLEKAQNGIGVGGQGDPSFTLDTTGGQSVMIAATLTAGNATGEGVRPPGRRAEDDVNLIAFDAAQITHPENRVNSQPGDPNPPLAATGQPMIAGTLRTHPRPGSADAGMVTPVAPRGRDSGGQLEAGAPGDPAFTVRTPGGGSSYPMIAHTLTGEGFDASEDGTGRGTPLIAAPMAFNPQTGSSKGRIGYGDKPTALQANQITGVQEATAVRRLTPMECERLQGFPDDWTRWLDDGTEQSDSGRYRQCGNAVAVPVVEWIARRLEAVDQATAARGAA